MKRREGREEKGREGEGNRGREGGLEAPFVKS